MSTRTALIFLCLISITYCQVVNITVTPSNATLLVGQNLTIQCTTDEAAEVIVRINGEETDQVTNVDSNSPPNDRTYQYISVTREDNGLSFTCFVAAGGFLSDEVILNVQFEPVYTFSEEEYYVNEGYRFVAVADVSANPDVMEADVVWRKDNTVLSQTSNIQLNATTLTIVSASRDDAGSYSITGTNDIGMGSASFDLDVFFGPQFTSNGGSISVSVGEALVIDCTTGDSNPAVQYVSISGTDLNQTTLSEGNRLYTVIDSVTTEFNGHNYTCTAGNGQTMATIMYTVYVTEISTSVVPTTTTSSVLASISASSPASPPNTTDPEDNGISSAEIGGIVAGSIIGAILIVVAVVIVVVVLFFCVGSKAKA